MLCQFTFANFRSYQAEATLDMQSTNIQEFSDTLLSYGEDQPNYLPVAAIYGPNGGGKSNAIYALISVIQKVLRPLEVLKDNSPRFSIARNMKCTPFLFDEDSRNKPTDFQLFFCTPQRHYRYNLSLFQNKVVSESLYQKNSGPKSRITNVFIRNNNQISLGPSIRRFKPSVNVNDEMPYISFLTLMHDIPVVHDAITWFRSCIVMDYNAPRIDQTITLHKDPAFKAKLLSLLNSLDLNISDYRLIIPDPEKRNEGELIFSRNINGETYEISYFDESNGTQKIFALLPIVIAALSKGSLLIADELDAKLHPKLTRFIIHMFKNPTLNPHKAQLLITSQDVSCLNSTVFRRDEVWFAAHNSKESSELYSLIDIRDEKGNQIKNTSAYDKQYLDGRYGADPYLTEIKNWSV